MSDFCSIIKRPAELTPHATIITSLILITLFVTDRFNGAMHFIDHDLTSSMMIICAAVFLYQTIVFFIDFRKKRKLVLLLLASAVTAILGLYLLAVCARDLLVDAKRLMLLDYNKFSLLGYAVLSIVTSFCVINVQRAFKRDYNRKNSKFSRQ